MSDLLYLKEHKLLLVRNLNGFMPIMYNVKSFDENTGECEGIEIKEDCGIIFDWVLYIKKSMQEVSKKNGKIVRGNLYAWQWGLSIEFINDVMSFNADVWDISVSRQSGRVLPF